MFNKSDISRDACMLSKSLSKCGYDWWWHSFMAKEKETGKEKSFFIEFFLCNPYYAKDYPVFGQLEENQKNNIVPSYLMIKVGTWGEDAKQINRFFAINKIKLSKVLPFSLSADDCFLSEKETYGTVKLSKEECTLHSEYMSSYGEMSWNLKIEKNIAFNVGYGASKLFRDMQAFEMFWHAEGMKTKYSGSVILDGKTYIVSKDNCYGYADKNWGKNFTSPWVWLSSNNLTSNISKKVLKNSVFDIGGGRPKIYNIKLNRKLLSAFFYEGKCYEFNFSKFWTFTRTKFNCKESLDKIIWHVEQRSLNKRMIVDISCDKKDMLFINYESPDGKKRHNRLWNGGTGIGTIKLYKNNKLIDEIEAKNVGCEYRRI